MDLFLYPHIPSDQPSNFKAGMFSTVNYILGLHVAPSAPTTSAL